LRPIESAPEPERRPRSEPAADPAPADPRTGFRTVRPVKLAVVVQRYAADIGGGSELHAR
jgi:hypothetical protein